MTLNRSAVMKDAWRRYRDGQRLQFDWTFGRCLMVAWQAAKMRQRNPRKRYQPDEWPTYRGGLVAYLEIHGDNY